LTLGPGPQLVWGPNAAGKTTLLEAVVLLALGRSHRTVVEAELIRWGADYLRVDGVVLAAEAADGPSSDGVALDVSMQVGGRKRIQVNGVPRRPAALAEHLRTVLFAPEEMLLVIGPPTLRRSALDQLAVPHDPMYLSHVATYTRALAQRNSLLRSIRNGEPTAPSCATGTAPSSPRARRSWPRGCASWSCWPSRSQPLTARSRRPRGRLR
jgi:DNA replication and repair protein RecF